VRDQDLYLHKQQEFIILHTLTSHVGDGRRTMQNWIVTNIHRILPVLIFFVNLTFTFMIFLTRICASLSSCHSLSSGCGWWRRPPCTKGGCEYIE